MSKLLIKNKIGCNSSKSADKKEIMAASSDTPYVQQFQGKSNMSSAEFIEIFNKYDKDGNGFIEKKELDLFLDDVIKNKNGVGDSAIEKQKCKEALLSQYDANSDCKFSMHELAKVLPTEENFLLHFRDSTKLHIADFMKIWYHYDADRSGYLEVNELKGFLRDLLERKAKQKASIQQIDDYTEVILDLFDKNHDDRIELSELAKILPIEENFLSKFQSETQLSKKEFEELFTHYDQDHNGYIEDTELMGFLRDLLENKERQPSTADLEQYRTCIMEISDVDKDGRLSKSELELLLTIKSN